MYDTIHHGPQYPVYAVGLCTSYLRIRIELLPTPGDSMVSQDPATRLSRRTFTVGTDPVSQSISESSGGMMRTERWKSREHEEVTRTGPAESNLEASESEAEARNLFSPYWVACIGNTPLSTLHTSNTHKSGKPEKSETQKKTFPSILFRLLSVELE